MEKNASIDRGTLSQQVYARLKEQILAGELKQGERLSEIGIAQSLGVSPTPVREALRLLNGDGLVGYFGRKGAKVIRPTADDVRQCFAVRRVLERLALREASAKLSSADKARLEQLAETPTEDGPGAGRSFFKADHAFHGFFIGKADNTWLANFLSSLSDFLLVVRAPLLESKITSIEQVRMEHRAVAKALAMDRIDDAERLLDQHIERVCNDVLRTIASSAVVDTDDPGFLNIVR